MEIEATAENSTITVAKSDLSSEQVLQKQTENEKIVVADKIQREESAEENKLVSTEIDEEKTDKQRAVVEDDVPQEKSDKTVNKLESMEIAEEVEQKVESPSIMTEADVPLAKPDKVEVAEEKLNQERVAETTNKLGSMEIPEETLDKKQDVKEDELPEKSDKLEVTGEKLCKKQDTETVNELESDKLEETLDKEQEVEKAIETATVVEQEQEFLENVEKANEDAATIDVQQEIPSSGLSLLAQYDSDNEESDVEFVKETKTSNYRSQVVTLDSETDSTEDSSTSSSANEEVEGGRSLKRLYKKIDKRIAEDSDDDENDDDELENGESKTKGRRKPPKVKGEMLLEDLPPIEDLHITVPEEECIELGRIHSIVDQLLLVSVLPNSLLLDLDTVLFLDKGKRVLGEVFDVLGQVAAPLYCVRFNSNAQIKEKNINVGDIVYVAPKTEHTQFVILSNLMQVRGSDASWENDIEPPQRYIDYSDDEQERSARRRTNNKDRQEPTEHTLQPKRACADNMDSDDTMSVISCSSTTSSIPSSEFRFRGRGRGRAGGRGAPNHNYFPSYDSGSWHNNFYRAASSGYGHYPMPPPTGPHGSNYGHAFNVPPPYPMNPGYFTGPHMRPPMPPSTRGPFPPP